MLIILILYSPDVIIYIYSYTVIIYHSVIWIGVCTLNKPWLAIEHGDKKLPSTVNVLCTFWPLSTVMVMKLVLGDDAITGSAALVCS